MRSSRASFHNVIIVKLLEVVFFLISFIHVSVKNAKTLKLLEGDGEKGR